MNTLTRQDLEIAIDLTRLSMTDPCLTELEYVLGTAKDLMDEHYVLLMALENYDDNLSNPIGTKPLRIASSRE